MANNQTEATLLLAIKSAGEEVLSKTGDALATIGKIATAAYGAANAAAAASIHAYSEQEKATNSLNQALINQGIYSKALSKEYDDIAKDLQKVTVYADENILAAEAQLQKYLGQTKVTRDLTAATLDFASSMGLDLESAATAVGKAIGTSTNGLARYGIQIDENVPKSIKLDEVIKGLNSRFGGQAKAAADGLGSLVQMKNALGDVLEAAGEKLAPVVAALAKDITKFAQEVQNNELVLENFTTAAKLLAQSAVYLKNIVIGLGEAIGQTFGTIVGAALQLAQGQFRAAMTSLKDGFSGTATAIVNRSDVLQEELQKIDDAFARQKEDERKKELENIKKSNDNKVRLQNELIITQEQMFAYRDEKEIVKLESQERLKNDAKLRSYNEIIYRENDLTTKLKAENDKREYLEQAYFDDQMKNAKTAHDYELLLQSEKVTKFEGVLSNMEQMQNSSNKYLVGIGKAAAIAHTGIKSAQGAMAAYTWFAENVDPIAGYAAAGTLALYGAEQIKNIAGIQLAEGGIVKATPGGVPAIIGEGGRDEMVIPLDKSGNLPNSGVGVNLTVYGGFLGNEAQAKAFAIALDRELLRLRQSNASLAFDRGII